MAFKQKPTYRFPNQTLGGERKDLQSVHTSMGYWFPLSWSYFVVGHCDNIGSNWSTIQNYAPGYIVRPVYPATRASLVSSNANDTNGGTGANLVLVSGTRGDGYWTSEIVALNGTTPVLTTNEYLLVDNAVVVVSGAATRTSLGNINCYSGTQFFGRITPEHGAMLSATMLVPKNYYFFFTRQAMGGSPAVEIRGVLTFDTINGGTNESYANSFFVDDALAQLDFQNAPVFPPGTFARFDAKAPPPATSGATTYFEGGMVHTSLVDPRGSSITAPVGYVYDTEDEDILPRQ